ncbi:MAG: TonB-dependent receptor plug domain-containing protein, partial [Pseudomonadales bacterium]|nr:TonB-dependent receptor plug domain-containing protein [Pseudomonadales bacterium]
MIRKLLVSSIAASAAMAALPTSAQSIAGSEVINEIEVISTARRSEGLADINAAVSVLGSRELNLIALTHYQEALDRLPGVNVHRNNGQESLASIRSPVFTGAGACGEFLVAENGIPLRAAGFCNVNEMFDAHSENAQQIEVVRGPGSAFWGSNAVHGLINVVLPEPGDVGSLRLEAGPRGSYRVRGALGYDYGNFKQAIYVNGQDEEGYRDDSGVDQQKVSWLYNYTTANGTELDGGFTISNLNQETAGFVVGTNAYEDSTLRETNPNPEAYRDSASSRVWTRITQEVDDWEIVLTP